MMEVGHTTITLFKMTNRNADLIELLDKVLNCSHMNVRLLHRYTVPFFSCRTCGGEDRDVPYTWHHLPSLLRSDLKW